MKKILGPFTQLLTMKGLPERGSIIDEQLDIVDTGGLLIEGGLIKEVSSWSKLCSKYPHVKKEEIRQSCVALPGFIDAHTHICSAGNRAADYAMRLAGKSYLEIAEAGGGIWHTVTATRNASLSKLVALTKERAVSLLQDGITTCEVKSGYGLSVESEINILNAIKQVAEELPIDIKATCLAAHIKPKDFNGSNSDYLKMIQEELLPDVWKQQLASRVDAFVEKSAFSVEEASPYLQKAKSIGFDIVIHADQFTTGGSKLAIELDAVSADHLEASGDEEIDILSKSEVIAVALPGASIGLGDSFTPARKLLDYGGKLVIASDWNPGSAPMGKLLIQAAILGAYQRLHMAETLAGITCRAANALGYSERGILSEGMLADIVCFPCSSFQEIIYKQGVMKPLNVWKKGEPIKNII